MTLSDLLSPKIETAFPRNAFIDMLELMANQLPRLSKSQPLHCWCGPCTDPGASKLQHMLLLCLHPCFTWETYSTFEIALAGSQL